MRLHEHGVLARFRYNDLKEAARAADAGPMQIEWSEGPVLSRAETVLQGTTHDTMRAEIGYGEKVSRRLWSKKLEEGIGLTARQRDAECLEIPEFSSWREWFHAAALIRGGERS